MPKILRFIILFVVFSIPLFGISQGFKLPSGQEVQKVNFKLINNLIIIPVELNGAKLSFILDTGVTRPILFNLSDKDSVQIKDVSEVTINGLGSGEPIKALKSLGNTIKIKNISNKDQLLYVILDKGMNLSPTLGIPVHGIIGYNLFRDFVVDLNYAKKTIKFYDPKHYKYKKSKKSETLPLVIRRSKAYVDAGVYVQDDREVPVKLLLDTGSSDAIWLLKNVDQGIGIPANNYDDFLGKGLNGDIFGKRSKVHGLRIGNFSLPDAKVAFPDITSFKSLKDLSGRNGSLGGEVLKRFNIIFDYSRDQITLRKNGNFKTPFHYNLSGIELQHGGVRYIAERIANSNGVVRNEHREFGDVQILLGSTTRLSVVPEIIVSGIRAGSPADLAGLKQGDLILAVNGKSIHTHKIQEITEMLNRRAGKTIRLLIEREGQDITRTFVLKKVFE